MRTLQGVFEGLLDPDFDGDDIEAMPKVGEAIIDLWSKVKKHTGTGWPDGEGWIIDRGEFQDVIDTTYKTLVAINKNGIGRKTAKTIIRTGDGNPDTDVCLICVSGDPHSPTKTLGIARLSTREALYFDTVHTKSKGLCGFIWDTALRNRASTRSIANYIEPPYELVWRKYWLIPGYCFDVIKRKIIK